MRERLADGLYVEFSARRNGACFRCSTVRQNAGSMRSVGVWRTIEKGATLMFKRELLERKAVLEAELLDVNKKLDVIGMSEKPFESVVYGYSSPGVSSTFWKTEAQARKKYEEYHSKTYFKNGLIYGVILRRNNADGTRTVLDYESKARN